MDITPEQALNIISQPIAEYRGTLAEHQTLQAAMAVLLGVVRRDKENLANKEAQIIDMRERTANVAKSISPGDTDNAR